MKKAFNFIKKKMTNVLFLNVEWKPWIPGCMHAFPFHTFHTSANLTAKQAAYPGLSIWAALSPSSGPLPSPLNLTPPVSWPVYTGTPRKYQLQRECWEMPATNGRWQDCIAPGYFTGRPELARFPELAHSCSPARIGRRRCRCQRGVPCYV